MLHGTARIGMDWFGLAEQGEARSGFTRFAQAMFVSVRQCAPWYGLARFYLVRLGWARVGDAWLAPVWRCEVA